MSDRIKKIKIKQADGTMSDYYPIGADASNVDIDYNNSTLEVTMKKTPRYYENVASMKLDDTLQEGDMAITLGYYSKNDGGGAEYQIVNDNTLVDDGGSIHDLENGLKAKLIIQNNEINVKCFGAKGNKNTDDTQAIQKAIQYAESLESHNYIVFPNGRYLISNTIELSDVIGLKGQNSIPTLYYNGNNILFKIIGHSKFDIDGLGSNYPDVLKPIIENLSLISITDLNNYYGNENNGIAIKFFTGNNTTLARSFLRNVSIYHFYKGIETAEKNFYINTFENVHFIRNYYGVFFLDGTNMGEKITFSNSLFDSNRIAVHTEGQSHDLFFISCSIDMNLCFLHSNIIDSSRKITISNCHIEQPRVDYFDITKADYPYGLIWNMSGFFSFNNNKTVINLTIPQINYTRDNVVKRFVFTNNEWNWWDTNYNNLQKTNNNFFLVDNYNGINGNSFHEYYCKAINNISLQGNLGIPYSVTNFETRSSFLTWEITAGDAHISETDGGLSDINHTKIYQKVISNKNMEKITIGNLNSTFGIKPFIFIPSNNEQQLECLLETDIINFDPEKNYSFYIIGKNIEKVEFFARYYSDDTFILNESSHTFMNTNNSTETIISWPSISYGIARLPQSRINQFSYRYKITNIQGYTPEIYFVGIYSY